MARILGVLFALLLYPIWLWAQPTFNATTSCGGTGVASLSCNLVTVNGGTDRVMLIGVGQNWCGSSPNSEVSSVSYGTQTNATLVHRRCSGVSLAGVDYWLLINPSATTATLSATLTAVAHTIFLGHQTWNGITQTNPVRDAASSHAFGNTVSISVPSVAGDLVVGLVHGFDATLVSGQTSQWTRNIATVYGNASSTSAAGTSTNLTWSRNGEGYWAAQGLSLIPSATTARRRFWVVQP